MTTENIRVGAWGWHHDNWNGCYYPDDMPEDWQLTYYGNEFNAVLVPKSYWDVTGGYDVGNWCEAVEDDFRFYLECPMLNNKEALTRFEDQARAMGSALGGVVIKNEMKKGAFNLECSIFEKPLFQSEGRGVGFVTDDLEDLRKVRASLDAIDHAHEQATECVFVGKDHNQAVPIETLLKIKSLSEMMGL